MGLFRFAAPSGLSTAPQEAVRQHKRLRPVRMRLNNELVSRFSRDVIQEGARKLGMLNRGVVVLNTEDETSVLMDYCIYDVHRNGRNAVEQYLCDCPPDPDSDEMLCLRVMQHATYAVIVALGVEPGVGCRVRNLLTDEERLLVDMAFSKTGVPGMVLATRLWDFGSFITTSGAALPLGILDREEMDEWQRKFRVCGHGEHSDPAPLIRKCLEKGGASQVRFEGPSARSRPKTRRGPTLAGTAARAMQRCDKRKATRPLETRRCRCGSGKMVKNCCGKR